MRTTGDCVYRRTPTALRVRRISTAKAPACRRERGSGRCVLIAGLCSRCGGQQRNPNHWALAERVAENRLKNDCFKKIEDVREAGALTSPFEDPRSERSVQRPGPRETATRLDGFKR
jgi:hypothetical protein